MFSIWTLMLDLKVISPSLWEDRVVSLFKNRCRLHGNGVDISGNNIQMMGTSPMMSVWDSTCLLRIRSASASTASAFGEPAMSESLTTLWEPFESVIISDSKALNN